MNCGEVVRPPAGSPPEHYALVVDDEHTIERVLVPQLRRTIAARETILMVVGEQTAAVVRAGLGHAADGLLWAPTDRFYQRLGFTYARFLRYLRDQHSGLRRVHLVTEPDLVQAPGTPVDRAAAYLSYEAMANRVFAGYGCPITCIWHSGRLRAPVTDQIREVHPREWTAAGAAGNPGFVRPDEFLERSAQRPMTAAPPVTDIDITVRHVHEIAAGRAAVARWAAGHHFVPTAVGQIVAAAGEVITNGVRHGRPPVRIRAWNHDTTLVLHVDDHGGRPIPPEAGYRPPATPAGPTGLWVARQLADVLLTGTGGGRTAVRMYFPYAVTHRHLDVPHIT
ncbi:MEDS domain-containing protein [Actinoplanes sp. Pm04-4]|uniref:MEDS domain-containing protein n=1 Tax=Paractinoplanes pyxinae TaxID=2997416 RepID=A0ABT4AQN2_9ACTN|nr:MEDS domain-containing protein [Actinoplanes pyxinae]MCY1136549.1 MEDS domain-containing protein [Actinoplanes pyxinae]